MSTKSKQQPTKQQQQPKKQPKQQSPPTPPPQQDNNDDSSDDDMTPMSFTTTSSDTYQGTSYPNRDIILSKKDKKQDKNNKKVVELQPIMSKSVLRKMAKLARDKESKKHRLHSLEILQEHQFDGDKRVLFQQSGTIGTERTKSEELARLYGLKQAGVQLSTEDQELLRDALIEFGDLDNSHIIANKKATQLTTYAHKTMTANPFMPLSTASATITATLQDRLLGQDGKGNQKQRKIYSSKELATIASNMNVTEFDVSHIKKLKKRQRREENALVSERLKKINATKIHEMGKKSTKMNDNDNDEDDEYDDEDNEQDDFDDVFRPEQLIVLPKELRQLGSVLEQQSGGKVRVITSKVSGGQLHKLKQNQLPPDQTQSQSSLQPTNLTPKQSQKEQYELQQDNDAFQAAAHLISQGLLTTKSKDKIDAIFQMATFSDSDNEQDDDNDNNNDDDEICAASTKSNNKSSNKPVISADEALWGLGDKVSTKNTKMNKNDTIQNKKKVQTKNNIAMDDEFTSAASAITKMNTNTVQLGPILPDGDQKDRQDGFEATTTIPASLAMPTVTRTNKAAVAIRDIPIAVLGNNVTIIHKGKNATQTNNNTVVETNITTTKRSKHNTTSQNTTPNGFSQKELVQLQQKENEYSVGFQVLKSRDVRNFLQAVHDGNNADVSDAEDDNTYTQQYGISNKIVSMNDNNNEFKMDIYGTQTTTTIQDDELNSKGKKRKLLFDFTQPVTVNTNQVVRSTIEIAPTPTEIKRTPIESELSYEQEKAIISGKIHKKYTFGSLGKNGKKEKDEKDEKSDKNDKNEKNDDKSNNNGKTTPTTGKSTQASTKTTTNTIMSDNNDTPGTITTKDTKVKLIKEKSISTPTTTKTTTQTTTTTKSTVPKSDTVKETTTTTTTSKTTTTKPTTPTTTKSTTTTTPVTKSTPVGTKAVKQNKVSGPINPNAIMSKKK